MNTKKGKKNKRKLITKGHGSEPTVIEFNLSKAVMLCIIIGVIITTITTVKVITTIIGAKQDNVLADENETYAYVQSSDGIQVPVPKGYVASQIPGETSVNGGFVIYEDNYNGKSIDWNSILVDTNSLSANSLEASSQTSDTTNGTSVDETTDNNLNISEEINEEETELDQTPSSETTNNDNKVYETKPVDEPKETTGTEGTSETESTDKAEDSEGTEITDNNEGVDDNTDKSDYINDEKITEQEEEHADKITEGTTEEQEEKQDNNEESESQEEDNNKEEQINNEEGSQEQDDENQETNQPVKLQSTPNTVSESEDSIQLYANSTQQDINIFNLQKSVNQYVWVPVSEENLSRIYGVDSNGKLWGKLYNFSSTGRTANNWTETSGVMSITSSTSYREPAILSSYDKDSTLQTYLGGMTAYEFLSELEENYYATIKSIKEHGGFYIGRYETGGLSETAVVRKMETDINNQTWYTMYEKTKELSGTNDNVITSMIWGSLWDETLQWLIDSGATTSDGTQLTYELVGSNSHTWGNYMNATFSYIPADATTPDETGTKANGRSTLLPTGSANYTKVNNIYDLAGNVFDRTLEADSADVRSARGGIFVAYGLLRLRRSSSGPRQRLSRRQLRHQLWLQSSTVCQVKFCEYFMSKIS